MCNQQPTASRQTLALCVLALALNVGCTAVQGIREHIAYNDTVNDFVLEWRNNAWASQAWHQRKWQFVGQPYLREFGEGFRAGYADVANGGNGCTPALPPRKYWNWRYQSGEGQAKVAAWFAGYPHGAKAAEEDGAGLYSQIQVSESLRAEYRLGHEPPYKAPLFFHNPENWCPPGETMAPGEPANGASAPSGSVPPSDPYSPIPTPAAPATKEGASRSGESGNSVGALGNGAPGNSLTSNWAFGPAANRGVYSFGQNPAGSHPRTLPAGTINKTLGSDATVTTAPTEAATPPEDPYTVLPWATASPVSAHTIPRTR
jgi:hypothetical protein